MYRLCKNFITNLIFNNFYHKENNGAKIPSCLQRYSLPQLYFHYKLLNSVHWSSVKEFSCLKAIDFALEAGFIFWPI